MDDYIPVTILDAVLPEVIPHDQMMERIFRKPSTERNIPITALAFESYKH
jgi:hypothetical protein